MNLIIWLVVGGVLGWLASIVMRTDAQQGILLNVVVGIVGALIAGFVIAPLFGTGTINSNDYLLTDAAYAHQTGVLSPSLLADRESRFGPEYVSQLLTSIPEPSPLLSTLFFLLSLPLLPRRRRPCASGQPAPR